MTNLPNRYTRFYRVQREDGLYYNPNKPGNRCEATFDAAGKKYYGNRGLTNAKIAVKWLATDVNDHWRPPQKKTPLVCQIRVFDEIIKDRGIYREELA